MVASKRHDTPRARLRMATLLFIAFCLPGAASRADEIGAGKPEMVTNLLPTVVNISVEKQETAAPDSPVAAGAAVPPSSGSPAIKGYIGSGFVIDPSGLIVTNYHVVEHAFKITVMFSDGTHLPGTTKSGSRLADLALVKVQPDHPLKAARWGNSDALQVGDQVLAAGDPFGIGLSVSAGIVSGLNRDIQNSPYDDYIQTDATINHGNSGGPLFDMRGRVIGVNSAIISPTTGSAGLGFALPSNTAKFVIGRLQKYGWVRPSWIGVKLQQVTPDIAEARGMAQPQGVIVAWVLADGPAGQAGLAIGDVILSFNGRTPSDERALLRDIAQTPVGDKVTLVVRHDGAEQTISLTTREWPRDQWDARDAPVPAATPKIVIPPDLGLGLSPVSEAQRAGLGLKGSMDGVLVSSVQAGSDPAMRGVAAGDVILRVQDKPVSTAAEVKAGIDAARADKRNFVLMLILPKKQDTPGPKWIPLRVGGIG